MAGLASAKGWTAAAARLPACRRAAGGGIGGIRAKGIAAEFGIVFLSSQIFVWGIGN